MLRAVGWWWVLPCAAGVADGLWVAVGLTWGLLWVLVWVVMRVVLVGCAAGALHWVVWVCAVGLPYGAGLLWVFLRAAGLLWVLLWAVGVAVGLWVDAGLLRVLLRLLMRVDVWGCCVCCCGWR